MKKRISVFYYFLIVLLTLSVNVRSAEVEQNYDWALLKALQPSEELIVKLRNDKQVKGTFISLSDKMLILSNGNQTANFNRQDIKEIRLGHGRSLWYRILYLNFRNTHGLVNLPNLWISLLNCGNSNGRMPAKPEK